MAISKNRELSTNINYSTIDSSSGGLLKKPPLHNSIEIWNSPRGVTAAGRANIYSWIAWALPRALGEGCSVPHLGGFHHVVELFQMAISVLVLRFSGFGMYLVLQTCWVLIVVESLSFPLARANGPGNATVEALVLVISTSIVENMGKGSHEQCQ